MEFKSLNIEMKANESQRTFEGFASKFGNVDLHNDIIEKGAFSKTIQERHPKKAIKVFYQHQEPIGIPEVLEEQDDGLFVRGKLADTQRSKEILELMKMNVVDGMSIGFDIVKDEIDKKSGIRRLKELKLFEVSIVTFGANPEATVTDVKSLQMLKNLTDLPSVHDVNQIHEKLDRLNDALGDDLIQSKSGKLVVNMDELKAGRVLSRKNSESLRQAVQLIQEVLETQSDESDEEKHTTPDPTTTSSTDQQAFKELLQDIRSFAKR